MSEKEKAMEAYRKFKSEPVNPDLSPETQELVKGFHELADKLVDLIERKEREAAQSAEASEES
jgi:hypothetical protein